MLSMLILVILLACIITVPFKLVILFTQGEMLKFTGIPNFAPELFRRIRLRDPLKQKQLLKGLVQLSEEGAVQVFRPLANNDLIIWRSWVLQFDVVVARLKVSITLKPFMNL